MESSFINNTYVHTEPYEKSMNKAQVTDSKGVGNDEKQRSKRGTKLVKM